MDFSELSMLAFEASDELKQSQMYQDYLQSLSGLNDESIKPLIKAFEAAKYQYDQIMIIGKHHPDFKSSSARLVQAKTSLYQTHQYKAYLSAYETLNHYLGDVSDQINRTLESCLVGNGTKKACQKGNNHGQ